MSADLLAALGIVPRGGPNRAYGTQGTARGFVALAAGRLSGKRLGSLPNTPR